MRVAPRPHLLGIDDGPFEKFESKSVPIVGVMMEGSDLVEAVAVTRFGVDGDDVTGFLADWIGSLRFRPALHGVLFAGITIAGLAVLDVLELGRRTGLPILVVNRRRPENDKLIAALETAGLGERRATLERTPRPFRVDELHVAQAGGDVETAAALVRAARGKSLLPEPLRLAHLIARAVALGESRGRA